MAKAIFTVFFKVIKGAVTVVLTPINALVATLFPAFTNMISIFNNAVQTYVSTAMIFFFHILPPYTQYVILFYLSVLITYYTVSLTIHAILKIYKLIKNIKFW